MATELTGNDPLLARDCVYLDGACKCTSIDKCKYLKENVNDEYIVETNITNPMHGGKVACKCGAFEVIQKMRCKICKNCRVVRYDVEID